MIHWRPQLTPKLRLDALDLTPAEGFLLSRIDGSTTVEQLTVLTGLPLDSVLLVLWKLLEQKALQPVPHALSRTFALQVIQVLRQDAREPTPTPAPLPVAEPALFAEAAPRTDPEESPWGEHARDFGESAPTLREDPPPTTEAEGPFGTREPSVPGAPHALDDLLQTLSSEALRPDFEIEAQPTTPGAGLG